MPSERKVLNMIWANEAGVSVYIYEGEHGRREIEIHGVVNDYETVLARATIEKHNRDRVADAIKITAQERFALRDREMAELSKMKPPIKSAATSQSPLCSKCGYVMCQQFDTQPVNAVAEIAIPNGSYVCYYCTPATTPAPAPVDAVCVKCQNYAAPEICNHEYP